MTTKQKYKSSLIWHIQIKTILVDSNFFSLLWLLSGTSNCCQLVIQAGFGKTWLFWLWNKLKCIWKKKNHVDGVVNKPAGQPDKSGELLIILWGCLCYITIGRSILSIAHVKTLNISRAATIKLWLTRLLHCCVAAAVFFSV